MIVSSRSHPTRFVFVRFYIYTGFVALCVTYGLSLPHAARSTTAGATLRGTVKKVLVDGGIIVSSEAKIFLLDSKGSKLREETAGPNGSYRMQQIVPGRYGFGAVDATNEYQADQKPEQLLSNGVEVNMDFLLKQKPPPPKPLQ